MTTARDLQRSQRNRWRILETGKLSPRFARSLTNDNRAACLHLRLGAVVVAVIDVREGRGFELGIFHSATVASITCGLLRYNSCWTDHSTVCAGEVPDPSDIFVSICVTCSHSRHTFYSSASIRNASLASRALTTLTVG
jgi:hypothetical protein